MKDQNNIFKEAKEKIKQIPMGERKILEDLFLREKPTKIMMGLKTAKSRAYATILSREANCTYSHTIKILNTLKRAGVVDFEKTGRIKRVSLTDDGWVIAQNLEAILKKISQVEAVAGKEEKPKKEKRKKA